MKTFEGFINHSCSVICPTETDQFIQLIFFPLTLIEYGSKNHVKYDSQTVKPREQCSIQFHEDMKLPESNN